MRPRFVTLLAALALLGAGCTTFPTDDDTTGDDDTADDDTADDDTGDDDSGDDDTGDDDTADDDSGDDDTVPTQHTAGSGAGASARWAYEDAYDNHNGGDWYRDSNNETATLAWGESYVMMSLAAMFRATGDPVYLERLAWHADGVLAQRDDQRGVTDYRGVSGACWQNRSYQPANEPYCYVVHSGMIAAPMVEFARLVAEHGLGAERAYDGVTFGDKAAGYVTAAEATVAYHQDQWNMAGYYVFRPDATFLGYPGVDLPLNQSNAMGRLLLLLQDVTHDPAYLDMAIALAARFELQLGTGGSGEYLWNYWGGAYAAPGEDISHASINADFAVQAAQQGILFDAADLEAFAATFVANVYVDDRTFANHVGGTGGVNDSGYRPQAARWLRLSPVRTTIYTAVRDLYELDYPASGVGSGSLLLGWAYLAEFEPIGCDHFFYYVDWDDPDPKNDGDWRMATDNNANILAAPPDWAAPCMIDLPVDAPRTVDVQQWDGKAYHSVAVWQDTGGAARRHVPYEPRWVYDYWSGGQLYQFTDAFVPGDAILVQESTGIAPPAITSTPPNAGQIGTPVGYTPAATGDTPLWWSLTTFPVGARVDPATGSLDFTPAGPGLHAFTLRATNDVGWDEQSFDVLVP